VWWRLVPIRLPAPCSEARWVALPLLKADRNERLVLTAALSTVRLRKTRKQRFQYKLGD